MVSTRVILWQWTANLHFCGASLRTTDVLNLRNDTNVLHDCSTPSQGEVGEILFVRAGEGTLLVHAMLLRKIQRSLIADFGGIRSVLHMRIVTAQPRHERL